MEGFSNESASKPLLETMARQTLMPESFGSQRRWGVFDGQDSSVKIPFQMYSREQLHCNKPNFLIVNRLR